MRAIKYSRRPDGVAVLLFDTPGASVNILSNTLFDDLLEAFTEVERDPEVKAAVIASGKSDTFIAGADLHMILAATDPRQAEAFSREGQRYLAMLSASAKPYVAAIHGAALGGGLESALACHYRIATDHPKTVLALPEVQLGLLPAGGGTQRLPRLTGLARALPMLLSGKRLRARQALRYGVVDAVTTRGGLLDTAVRAALRLADGTLRPRRELSRTDKLLLLPGVRQLVLGRARREVLKRTRGFYPAPLCILDCLEEGFSKGAQAGLAMESKLFGRLAASSDSKNLIWLFDAMNELKKPLDNATTALPVRRLGVLGAGLMGEGIASVSLPLSSVVLKDVSEPALAKSARSLWGAMEKRRQRGSLSRVERDRQWYGLLFTTEPRDVAGADLVVEAVFEDLTLKRRVLAETEAVLDAEAVYASNTSALPITEIAAEARHPERILGMHYFSPVPKMPLLELVTTKRTSLQAVATARAYGVAQGKTVIVVRDGPGFYTTRILAPFLNEAVLLVEEGASVEALDEALKAFGFPVGPATLLDEVGIDVGAHVSKDLGAAFAGRGMQPTESFDRLVAAGMLGRKAGRGFYVYPDGTGKKAVNPEAYTLLGGRPRKPLDARMAADRLVLLMVNEALHCLSEGVIGGTRDGDVGAVLGLGFPPFFGGPFHYVDGLGASAVADRMKRLADAHGPRFTPAELLLQMAKGDRRFYQASTKSGEIKKPSGEIKRPESS